MRFSGIKHALVAAGFCVCSSVASAAFVELFEGNDCAGVFGDSFSECTIPSRIDPDETPIIIKFDFDTDTFEVSDMFPSIDGSEFDIDFDDVDGTTGTWTYMPGPDDPAINYFAAVGGNFFNLFSSDDPLTDTWSTPINPANDLPFALSHLSFYDTEGDEGGKVPEPTTLLLLGSGLLVAGLARRRRST